MNKLTQVSLALITVMALGSFTTSTLAKEASSDTTRFLAKTATVTTLADEDVQARRKPRVPGGSGCDDPRDVIEHPECSPALTAPKEALQDLLARSKPRVPGGSGCDDPRDVIEHPECSPALTAPKEALQDLLARSKPRVPGGSGCDSPRDKAEHPECRG
jgi:hypothetical protein